MELGNKLRRVMCVAEHITHEWPDYLLVELGNVVIQTIAYVDEATDEF